MYGVQGGGKTWGLLLQPPLERNPKESPLQLFSPPHGGAVEAWSCTTCSHHERPAPPPAAARSSRENRHLPECDLLKRILYLSLRVAALKDIILPFTSLGHWGGQAGTTDIATAQLPSPPTAAPLSTWVCSKPHGHANLKVCFQGDQTVTLGQCP